MTKFVALILLAFPFMASAEFTNLPTYTNISKIRVTVEGVGKPQAKSTLDEQNAFIARLKAACDNAVNECKKNLAQNVQDFKEMTKSQGFESIVVKSSCDCEQTDIGNDTFVTGSEIAEKVTISFLSK